jgi:hypothetical protein
MGGELCDGKSRETPIAADEAPITAEKPRGLSDKNGDRDFSRTVTRPQSFTTLYRRKSAFHRRQSAFPRPFPSASPR